MQLINLCSIKLILKSLTLIMSCTALVSAQGSSSTTGPNETVRTIGIVTRIESANRRITIKTDAGPEIGVSFDDVPGIASILRAFQPDYEYFLMLR